MLQGLAEKLTPEELERLIVLANQVFGRYEEELDNGAKEPFDEDFELKFLLAKTGLGPVCDYLDLSDYEPE